MTTRTPSPIAIALLAAALHPTTRRQARSLAVARRPPGWSEPDCRQHLAESLPDAEPDTIEFLWQSARERLSRAVRADLAILTVFDNAYPVRLRQISHPPHVLYCRGSLAALESAEAALAVVGTRTPTQYGMEVARRTTRTALEQGFTIVSGLALGIDTAALSEAARAGRPSIAVLANGLDDVYPRENHWLAERILESGGCLISENEPKVQARPDLLVQRNRIQTGLSHGVFLVESNLRGGSMRTAGFAVKQGRPLACCEHPPINRTHRAAQGPQKLIREGKARAIACRADFEQFLDGVRPQRPAPVEPKEAAANRISPGPVDEEICSGCSTLGF